MITKSVDVQKFRGFENTHIELGKNITLIAGKNGTQKTTLLGILSQPFSLKKHPTMKNETPLCGGNYISSFADKFRLSKKFDLAKSHEWTLNLYNPSETPFTLESIDRDKSGNEPIRFWRKGNRSQGAGYLQYPVIYLSLKRLLPIGEDKNLHSSSSVRLDDEEKKVFTELHKRILLSNDKVSETEYLESKSKNTIGVDTDTYDWEQNSAGQDNVGKIILALLSFQRLKKKYGKTYKGGILVIDEADATLFPASQGKLFEFLFEYSEKYDIQIIVTSHSLPLIKKASDKSSELKDNIHACNKIKLVYLEKKDNKIVVESDIDYESIKNRLNVCSPRSNHNYIKITVYTEDSEASAVAKQILPSSVKKHVSFKAVKLGCSELFNLVEAKVPSFTKPNAIVLLDGDIKLDAPKKNKISRFKNICVLPTDKSPERLIASFLNEDISDNDKLWENINHDYMRDVCFRDYSFDDIMQNRERSKSWFNNQIELYGRTWLSRILKEWGIKYHQEKKDFIDDFEKTVALLLKDKEKQKKESIV